MPNLILSFFDAAFIGVLTFEFLAGAFTLVLPGTGNFTLVLACGIIFLAYILLLLLLLA